MSAEVRKIDRVGILRVACVRAAFPTIRVPHGQTLDAIEAMEELRQAYRLNRTSMQRTLFLLAASHAGKSTAIEQMIHQLIVPEIAAERGLDPEALTAEEREAIFNTQKRVLWITLSEKTSVKGFAGDMLAGFDDRNPDVGTAIALRRRVKTYIEDPKIGVELVVVDEVYHLVDRDERSKTNKTVADAIKTLLITAHCPIVLAGITEAGPLLTANNQFGLRGVASHTIEPLRYEDEEEREAFVGFLGMMADAIVEIEGPDGKSLFPNAPDLITGELPALIHCVSQGYVGRAARLLEEACVVATRKGHDHVVAAHFAEAVDRWLIPQKLFDGDNPFHPAKIATLPVKRVSRRKA